MLDDLLYKLTVTRALTTAHLQISRERSAKYYNQKLNEKTFNVREYVNLLVDARKLEVADQYRGPHKITKLLPNHNIGIEIEVGKNRK